MADLVDILSQAFSLSARDQLEVITLLSAKLRTTAKTTNQNVALSARVAEVTQVPVDALVCSVNSAGTWGIAPTPMNPYAWQVMDPKSVDAAIWEVAGGQFHQQAWMLRGANEGDCLVTARQWLHEGAFNRVLFVVDDWRAPLGEIATKVLEAADRAGLSSIVMPLLRTDAGTLDVGSNAMRVESLVQAVRAFQGRYLERVHMVARDAAAGALLEQALLDCSASIKVVLGDITRVAAQAILLGINSEGMWEGGLDRAIRGISGEQYHEQARALLGLPDGEVAIASSREAHPGPFEKVVFVVDDLRLPLSRVVMAGLKAADDAGLSSITIPALRMGAPLDPWETPESKVLDMVQAVRAFQLQARTVRKVTFVVYGDPITYEAFRRELARTSKQPYKKTDTSPPQPTDR